MGKCSCGLNLGMAPLLTGQLPVRRRLEDVHQEHGQRHLHGQAVPSSPRRGRFRADRTAGRRLRAHVRPRGPRGLPARRRGHRHHAGAQHLAHPRADGAAERAAGLAAAGALGLDRPERGALPGPRRLHRAVPPGAVPGRLPQVLGHLLCDGRRPVHGDLRGPAEEGEALLPADLLRGGGRPGGPPVERGPRWHHLRAGVRPCRHGVSGGGGGRRPRAPRLRRRGVPALSAGWPALPGVARGSPPTSLRRPGRASVRSSVRGAARSPQSVLTAPQVPAIVCVYRRECSF
mmetsp:Transcript_49358/g.128080  ORF Transcript_49358/g.128080 Transcript_49358/m.128080 type:complete len:289 (-) Transcript_49358:67-933(-)